MRVTFGTRTAIKNLHEIIDMDETVQALAACLYAGGDGLLILTDRRIMALRDDYSKYHYRAHDLSAVRKLDYDPVVHDGFALTTATGRLVVRKMHADDSGALVTRLRQLVPALVLEVTRPGHGGRVPVRTEPVSAPVESRRELVTAEVSAQSARTLDVLDAVPPSLAAASAAAATVDGDAEEADKGVLMGVLADLHAKGLLSDSELAEKLAQVAARP